MQTYRDVVANGQGVPVPGAQILVKLLPDGATSLHGGTLATLYDGLGNSIANPITSVDGSFAFAAANGKYALTVSFNGNLLAVVGPVELFDLADALPIPASSVSTSDGSNVQAKLNANASAIAANGSSIASNTSNIAANTANIASNTSAIATNATSISANAADLSALQLADYTALRAYSGTRKSVYVTGYLASAAPSGIAGPFLRDDHDTTTSDDNATCIVTAGGVRFKRVIGACVNAAWFGAKSDSNGTTGNGTDNTAALQAAINFAFASSTLPHKLFLPDGYYRVAGTLTIPNAHWALEGETHRTILWCDHNAVGLQVTNAGNYYAQNIDIRRVTGMSGVGVSLLSSPEGRWENVYLTNHSDNIQMQDSHLTTFDKCRISGATGKGINDLGRCFASELIATNVISNAYGCDFKSDWKVYGGAIEQNTTSDLLVSTTADYQGKYWGWVSINGGCHMEGLSGGTIVTDQIVVGPSGASVAGPNAKIGLMLSGSFVLGNSATRTAINFRQGDLCSVTENYFKDYLSGATLIAVGAACTGAVFMGNRWDGTGTFKSINASATNVLDFETENTAHASQVTSLTHSLTNGGRLRGMNTLSSAARNMALLIDGMRNAASTDAITIRTVGADLATLFTRISISGGADVGVVNISGARTQVSGTYTNPFILGTTRLWVNAGYVRFKDGSDPSSETDGAIVGAKLAPVAVASLPSAVTAGAGASSFVSDATATTFASVVAGGGANPVPVYSDGTSWRIG